MPRRERLDLPGIAQHVVQRGVARGICFVDEEDRRIHLGALREASLKHGCAIHAYVLMTNHVHLLATGVVPGAISRMMQAVGRKYVRHFNDRHGRTGTLWEGRYRSSLVDEQRYVLACYRYIELNPVRAGMVRAPEDHPWSSHHFNALGGRDDLLTPHPVYLALGDDRRRTAVYREIVEAGMPSEELDAVRVHLAAQRALGSAEFQAEVATRLGRECTPRRPGRPSKAKVGQAVSLVSEKHTDPGF